MSTLRGRIARFVPYFRGAGWALPGMIIATTVAAVTEPVIPAQSPRDEHNREQIQSSKAECMPSQVIGTSDQGHQQAAQQERDCAKIACPGDHNQTLGATLSWR